MTFSPLNAWTVGPGRLFQQNRPTSVIQAGASVMSALRGTVIRAAVSADIFPACRSPIQYVHGLRNTEVSDQHLTQEIGLSDKIGTRGSLVCCSFREAGDQQHNEVGVEVEILGVLDFNRVSDESLG